MAKSHSNQKWNTAWLSRIILPTNQLKYLALALAGIPLNIIFLFVLLRNRSVGEIIVLLGLLGLMIFGLTLYFKQQTSKQISHIIAAAEQIAQGDLSIRVKPEGQGAIIQLGYSFNQMVGNLQELHRSRNLLSRTMSPKVRQSLIENGLDFRGLVKTVGILFIDIRDFTRITEKYNTEQLVIFLNDYYTTIANQVHIEGGIIGKYGGDSILAYFGAPDSHPPHEIASAALLTALALQEAMDKLSERWTYLGMPPIKVGIGMTIGPVVAGPIGSADQFEYTVIGDAVNLASRLQELTRNVPGVNIIFSVEVYEALDDRIKEQVKIVDFDAYKRQLGQNGSQHPIRCVDLGEVLVKGKQGPVHVFGVPDL